MDYEGSDAVEALCEELDRYSMVLGEIYCICIGVTISC